MLDPRALEKRRDEIAESCRRRGVDADIGAAIALYQREAAAQTKLNDANRARNEHQKAGQRELSPEARAAHANEGRRLKREVARLEAELTEARAAFREALAAFPNFVHPDAPVGGEDDFAELRRWGEPPRFDFVPKDHLELGRDLDLIDFERGAKVAGPKFYYLKNEMVLLQLALERFALDVASEAGFAPHLTPDLARPEILDGIGFNPRGPETQVYSIANEDLCLIGTAEITLGGLHADEILDDALLPLRLAGLSHCYRTEAGAAGSQPAPVPSSMVSVGYGAWPVSDVLLVWAWQQTAQIQA